MPNGNGDITSILQILPSVQINNASRTSNTPGELNPANISISGGLPYQNSFRLDGFEINNDIDPAGATDTVQHSVRSGQSQGLNVDTSLLDSIVVLHSNVGAKYGRFSGGVVESNLRNPRKDGFHTNISLGYTSSKWTHYYIVEGLENQFANSTNENYQPNFTKHILRMNVESYLTKNLGFIASASFARSFIPLQAYNNGTSEEKRTQKRQNDNFLIKLYYNPFENLSISYHFAYMPTHNTYFTPNWKNSYYEIKSGGIQSGLKIAYNNDFGILNASLGYSKLENSRNSQANYRKMGAAAEGQWGSLSQIQDNANISLDFAFNTLELTNIKQYFSVGIEGIYQKALSHRPESTRVIFGCTNAQGTGILDNWGIDTSMCGNSAFLFQEHKVGFSTYTYGVWLEDNANIDLDSAGELNARFGIRIDGDDYFKKHTLAPRFSLSYTTPTKQTYQTQIIFGANRYYARNLLSYKYRAIMTDSRLNYSRQDVNAPWNVTTPTTMITGIYRQTSFEDLNVPYDDEIMGALVQNFGVISATVKYIHRLGKNQITQGLNTLGNEVWSNEGRTKADIVSLEISQNQPIDTFGLKHNYYLALDYNDTRRTYNTHSVYYSLNDQILYEGTQMSYANMPKQIYKQPFVLRFNTTHSLNIWRTKLNLNNTFRIRGKYDKIVLEDLNATCQNAQGGNITCESYSKRSFKESFSWDMRLGFESSVYKGNIIYINFDIYNVLNTKNLTTIGLENGVLLTGVPSNAGILTYELGRQFWAQVGYKF